MSIVDNADLTDLEGTDECLGGFPPVYEVWVSSLWPACVCNSGFLWNGGDVPWLSADVYCSGFWREACVVGSAETKAVGIHGPAAGQGRAPKSSGCSNTIRRSWTRACRRPENLAAETCCCPGERPPVSTRAHSALPAGPRALHHIAWRSLISASAVVGACGGG